MRKGILLTGVGILAVAAGFVAGSLNSSAHHLGGSAYHYEDCAAGNPITGGHHLEYCSGIADYWEQCSQQLHHPERSVSQPVSSEPEAYNSQPVSSEPERSVSQPVSSEPEAYNSQPTVPAAGNCAPAAQTHHTEPHHGHGGRHHEIP